MEKIFEGFSVGLLVWQIIIITVYGFVLYLLYLMFKFLKKKTR